MTYNQLIEQLAGERDIPKTHAKEILDQFFSSIGETLEQGKGVSVPDLGTFKTKNRQPGTVYSPYHQQKINVPPKRVVDFSPATQLKENLKFVETDDER